MKALYHVVGEYPTRQGHMQEGIRSILPTPRKRDAIRAARTFVRDSDESLRYATVYVVRIDETAHEAGIVRVK